MSIRVTAYLDGMTSDQGYKFVLTQDCTNWRAFRSAKGFKRFLDALGLKIDPSKTELHDLRSFGRGRCITMVCKDKLVHDGRSFFSLDQLPQGAQPYIDLCNGNYVQCYILDEGGKVTVYSPNPNAKEVYIPLDYFTCASMYG